MMPTSSQRLLKTNTMDIPLLIAAMLLIVAAPLGQHNNINSSSLSTFYSAEATDIIMGDMPHYITLHARHSGGNSGFIPRHMKPSYEHYIRQPTFLEVPALVHYIWKPFRMEIPSFVHYIWQPYAMEMPTHGHYIWQPLAMEKPTPGHYIWQPKSMEEPPPELFISSD